MSTTQAIDVQEYVDRIAEIFRKDDTIFPDPSIGENLVTKVITNKPAIIMSSDEGVIPYIVIFESAQPVRFLETAGRGTRDVEGGMVYEVEIYCVALVQPLNTQFAQIEKRTLAQAMRDALGRNMRLADPDDLTNDPLCRTHTRYEVPYNLPGTAPKNMIAVNVVVRAQVYVDLARN